MYQSTVPYLVRATGLEPNLRKSIFCVEVIKAQMLQILTNLRGSASLRTDRKIAEGNPPRPFLVRATGLGTEICRVASATTNAPNQENASILFATKIKRLTSPFDFSADSRDCYSHQNKNDGIKPSFCFGAGNRT